MTVTEDEEAGHGSFTSIACCYGVWVKTLAAFMVFMTVGYMDTTLAFNLRPFKLEPVIVGSVFMVSALFQLASVQIWSTKLAKRVPATDLVIIGLVIGALTALLSGPMTPIPVPNSVALVVARQVVQGVALGILVQAPFLAGTEEMLVYGLEQNVATKSIFAAFYNSINCLG